MDKETFEKILDAFESAGFEPRSYSGRAMYGRECLGVVCDNPTDCILQVIGAFAENNDGSETAEFCNELLGSRSDSMGYDKIVYWPSIEWQGDKNDEEELEEAV